jgi:hypothetical protein
MYSEPIISHLYTADPSARVFDGKLYIYPSHDRETAIEDNDLGDQYDMIDYHVFSLDAVGGQVIDHGVALALVDIPWAQRQLWAPDAAERDGTYYFYFPAKDADGVFRIGVASSTSPSGPFKAEQHPIAGSYSIDPCSLSMATDMPISISVASGAGNCRIGKRQPMIRRAPNRPPPKPHLCRA